MKRFQLAALVVTLLLSSLGTAQAQGWTRVNETIRIKGRYEYPQVHWSKRFRFNGRFGVYHIVVNEYQGLLQSVRFGCSNPGGVESFTYVGDAVQPQHIDCFGNHSYKKTIHINDFIMQLGSFPADFMEVVNQMKISFGAKGTGD